MKFIKGIGLFFFYPVFLLCLGFYAGVRTSHFFYPGEQYQRLYYEPEDQNTASAQNGESRQDSRTDQPPAEGIPSDDFSLDSAAEEGLLLEAAVSRETLSVETEYVLEERDIEGQTTVETTWKLPDKYVGMNREQFVEAMKLYEASPPLAEMSRGFESLEVLSFSRERVVVQMNYRYVRPSSSFYLAVYDNEVVVFLEDKETIYIDDTHIMLEELPEDIQQDIIDMLWIESEEKLYAFLEAYSS